MEDLTPEADFCRYRDHTNVEAMGRVFDAVAPRLLIVAAHFSRDAAEAEDLVQTTLVQAMERAEQYEPGRPLLPWLLGILVHRAKDQLRRARVRRTESLEDAPSTFDVETLVESAELREQTAHAVDTLDDPYREVVLLRLLHGLTPTEIAHTLGRAPGTVRVQLQRGLERLRSALPRGVALPAFLIAESGRGWDAVRGEVLGQASGAALGASVSTATATSVAPATPLAWKAAIGVAALGISIALVSVATRDEPVSVHDAPSVTSREPTSVRAAETNVPAVDDESRDRTQPTRDAIEPDSPAAGYRITVVDSSGAPMEDFGVRLHPLDRVALPIEARTNARGVTLLDAPPGKYRLLVDRYTGWSQTVAVTRTGSCLVTMPKGDLTVFGVVTDRDGNPVPEAEIYLLRPGEHDGAMLVGKPEESGEFFVRHIVNDPESKCIAFARARGYQPSSTARVSGYGLFHGGVEHPLVLGPRAARLSGRVVDDRGEPVPHARVVALVDEDARSSKQREREPSERGIDSEAIFFRADEHGAFDSFEIPPGDITLIAHALDPADSRVGTLRQSLFVGVNTECEIVLRPGTEVFGRVTDENSEPIPGAHVVVEWRGEATLGRPEDALSEDLAKHSTTTDANGEYTIGVLPGLVDWTVFAPDESRQSDHDRFEIEAGKGRRRDASIHIPRRRVVRVLDPSGEPLVGWRVAWGELVKRTQADGRCRVEGIQTRDSRLRVYQPEEPPETGRVREGGIPIRELDSIPPFTRELVLTMTPEEMPTASIHGSLLDENGRPFLFGHLGLVPLGTREGKGIRSANNPAFDSGAIAPGRYLLTLMEDGYGHELFGPFDVRAGEHLDVGVLTARRPAHVKVTVRASDDGDIVRPSVLLLSTRFFREDEDPIFSPHVIRLSGERGAGYRYEERTIPPDDYVLTVSGRDVVARTERIHLDPGEEFETVVEVDRGRTQTFVVHVDPDPLAERRDGSSLKVGVTIHTDAGRPVLWFREGTKEHRGDPLVGTFDVPLAPGRYVARIEDHRRGNWSGAFAEVSFEVPATGSLAPIDVYVPLP